MEREQVRLLPGAWIAIGLVLAFNLLVYDHGGLLGVTTWLVLALGGGYVLAQAKNGNLTKVLVGIGMAMWLGSLIRSNEFIQLLDVAVILGVLGLTLVVGSADKMRWRLPDMLKTAFDFGFGLIPHAFDLLGALASTQGGKYKKLGSIVKITVLATGLLVVFGGLLMASDPVFAQLVSDFFSDIWGRLIASAVVGAVVLWLTTRNIKETDREIEILPGITPTELCLSVLVLELLFGGFLLVQAKYLFASHEVFKTFNITYSDYVRRGFFELIAAVALGGMVVYLLGAKTQVEQTLGWMKTVSLVLVGELGLILLSAWWRDQLYIQAHGLTRIRIVGEVGVWCLAGVLLLLAAREVIKEINEHRFLMGLGTVVCAGVAYINIVNIDMQIVTRPPIRFEQPDYFVLGNLSTDAIAGWEQAVKAGSDFALESHSIYVFDYKNVWKTANLRLGLKAIKNHRDYLQDKYLGGVDLRRFNLSEYLAWGKMRQDRSLYFNTLDESLSRLDIVAKTIGYEETQIENWILNDFDYPLMRIAR